MSMENIERGMLRTLISFWAYRVFIEDLPVIVFVPFDKRTVTVLFEPDWLTDLEAFVDGRLILSPP